MPEIFVRLSQELVDVLKRSSQVAIGRWQNYHLAESSKMILFKFPSGPEKPEINQVYKLIIDEPDPMGFDHRSVVFLVPTLMPKAWSNLVLFYNETKKEPDSSVEFGVGPVFHHDSETEYKHATLFAVCAEHAHLAKSHTVPNRRHRVIGLVDLADMRWSDLPGSRIRRLVTSAREPVFDHRTFPQRYSSIAVIERVKDPNKSGVFYNIYAPTEVELDMKPTHRLDRHSFRELSQQSESANSLPQRQKIGDLVDFSKLNRKLVRA